MSDIEDLQIELENALNDTDNQKALYNIGDKVRRIDCDDPKEYTIDKIRAHRGYWIYSMEGQGWADGWAWVAEWNIKRSE